MGLRGWHRLPSLELLLIVRLVLALQRHITPNATEEIKFDGYRAISVKSGRTMNSTLAEALRDLPEDTVVDGEVVALR